MHAVSTPGSDGRWFAFDHPPAGGRDLGDSVLAPPFAEELNRSRHMIAAQARAFAAMGWGVLLLDLYGTGDSDGEFADASWETWLEDIEAARRWLSGRGRTGPVALWGVRLGCLLALDALRRRSDGCPLCVLWQPVANGEAFLTQFLRVRTAAGLTRAGPGAETPKALRARLEAGETLAIGGHPPPPSLARSTDRPALAHPRPPPRRGVLREGPGGAPARPRPSPGGARMP